MPSMPPPIMLPPPIPPNVLPPVTSRPAKLRCQCCSIVSTTIKWREEMQHDLCQGCFLKMMNQKYRIQKKRTKKAKKLKLNLPSNVNTSQSE